MTKRSVIIVSQQSIFDPCNLQALVKQRSYNPASIARLTEIPEPKLRSYLDGREIPTLEDVVKLYWCLQEPIEIILGLKEMETYEARMLADRERQRASNLWRIGLATPIDTSTWPELYYTSTDELDLPTAPRHCLQRSLLDVLGYTMEIAKAGKILGIRGVGRVGAQQILDMIIRMTGEDYRELNLH